jgi:hypothetical protein
MKKLITSVCALALTFSVANAQDHTPKSGDWSLGTDAGSVLTYVGNLISGTADAPGVDFAAGGSITGKLFTDDMTAWRATANLGLTSYDDGAGTEMSGYDVTLGLGKEFRKGTSNLQGYYGYAAGISLNSSTVSVEEMDDVEDSGMGFAAGGFVGVEYFVRPKMGLSAEYAHGLVYETMNEESFFGIGGGTTSINLNFYF